ncbi:MAG TPA: hypothetical protein VL947_06815 [Cytophagales bacterium]|nr:hypothetical protein [Cytophagales bacterium]
MIIYGWNSFKLETCNPTSLGLPSEFDAAYTIERHQKYFHLFWIPFFSLGKRWVLRKRPDQQLYEPSAELLKFLNALPVAHKTPWYTYTLLYVIMLGGLVFYIYEKIDQYQSDKHYEGTLYKNKVDVSETIAPFKQGIYHYSCATYSGACLLKVDQI